MRKFFPITCLILAISFNCFSQSLEIEALDQAVLFKDSQDYTDAIAVISRLDLKQRSYSSKLLLARLYYLNGSSDKALKRLLSLKDKDWLAFLYLGLVYEDSGQIPQAIAAYWRSRKLKENSIALYRTAKIYYRKQDYEKAEDLFTKIISIDPSLRLAYYYKGNCLLFTKNYEKAYFYFTKCKGFYPYNKEIKRKFDLVKKNLGKDYFSKAVKDKDQKRKEKPLKSYTPLEGIPSVSIGLAKELKRFAFRCGSNFTIKGAKNKRLAGSSKAMYSVIFKNKQFYIHNYETRKLLKRLSGPITIFSNGSPFYVFDVAYGKGSFWHKKLDRMFRGSLKAIVKKRGITLINVLSVEEYLYGVLPSEISASYGFEALKAQAVAARTITFRNYGRHRKQGFDLCSDVHCQAYQGMSAEHPLASRAVDETRGEILTYKLKPVEAFYHSNCGGMLNGDVFGVAGYLETKPDSFKEPYPEGLWAQELWFLEEPKTFCSNPPNSKFRWQRFYDEEDFNLSFGFKLRDLVNIIIVKKNSSLRNEKVKLITAAFEKTISGGLKIRNFFDKLKSSGFKVEIKYSPQGLAQALVFFGGGFGHGGGLCQEGARSMASQKYSYKDILRHYYPKTRLKKQY